MSLAAAAAAAGGEAATWRWGCRCRRCCCWCWTRRGDLTLWPCRRSCWICREPSLCAYDPASSGSRCGRRLRLLSLCPPWLREAASAASCRNCCSLRLLLLLLRLSCGCCGGLCVSPVQFAKLGRCCCCDCRRGACQLDSFLLLLLVIVVSRGAVSGRGQFAKVAVVMPWWRTIRHRFGMMADGVELAAFGLRPFCRREPVP